MDKHNISRVNSDHKIQILSQASDCCMTDEWYKFATDDHFWMQWRFEALKRIIPHNFVWGQTMEIGCGTGVARDQVEKHYDCSVIGCDLNLPALRLAVKSPSPLYFYDINQQKAELRESFSTILMLDVLEHIGDVVPFLNSVGFHLKTEGRVIINVPAIQSLYSTYDEIMGHVRRYNITSLRNELRLAGFCIEHASYWGISLMPLLMLRKFLSMFQKKDQVIKKGFQPSNALIDHILRFLMRIECSTYPSPPIGSSLLAIAKKI